MRRLGETDVEEFLGTLHERYGLRPSRLRFGGSPATSLAWKGPTGSVLARWENPEEVLSLTFVEDGQDLLLAQVSDGDPGAFPTDAPK